MEALRGEDSVIFGDDSAEENYQRASDLLPETSAGVASVVDSIRSTVKSAVGMLSEVSLGLEGDQILDKEITSLDDIRQNGKEDQLGTEGDNFLGKEIQPGGDNLSYSKSMAEEKGLSGSGASEDWSVVDPIPEAQNVVSKHVREGEKQESDQADTASYESSLTAETMARENDAEESTAGSSTSKVAAGPEIRELAAEALTFKFRAAACAKEPEIQAVDDSQVSFDGTSSLNPSLERAPFSDKPMSLRRRNRSSKAGDAGCSSLESGVAGLYPHVSAAHFSPRSHERDGARGLNDRPKEDIDEWDNRSSSSVGITQPKAAESLKGKAELQGEKSDIASFGSSLGRSETVNVGPSEQQRKTTYPSGYESDTEDEDEAESGLTRLERRLAKRGTKKDEEAAGSSVSPDSQALTSGRSPRREVYTIPDSDVELEQEGISTQFSSWPVELLVQAVGFQMKLIVQVVAVSLWMFNFACSLVARPIQQTMQVKDRATDMATGAVNQGVGLISQVGEGIAQTGPLVTKLSKKTIMGCLGSAYVVFVLSILLIPAFFVDLFLVSRMVEEPVQLREILNFDYTQARPSAMVPILSGQDLEKAKTLPIDKLVSFRRIPAGHNFHINVILTMPESEYNIRLGMFQVTAEMISARNQVLMRQSKPCMLRFRSTPIRLFKTIFYSIPLLMGFTTEAQKLEVTVLNAQEKLVPTASVRILLEPKAGYLEGSGLPELYEAELHLESALPWPKAIIRRWKWTFYVWNGVCLFLFEVAMILCCCRQVLLPDLGGGKLDMENIVTGEVKEEKTTKKSKNKRRVCFEDDVLGGPGTEGGQEGSSLTGDRSEEAYNLSNNSDDDDVDAGWSMPPLEEAISSVEEGVTAMEETVKTLGETLVEGVSEVLGQTFNNVTVNEKS